MDVKTCDQMLLLLNHIQTAGEVNLNNTLMCIQLIKQEKQQALIQESQIQEKGE